MATGGKRPGSGRKPQALAVYRLRAADWDAYNALRLFVTVMDDETQPINLRLQCAEVVIKTVWGDRSVRQVALDDTAALSAGCAPRSSNGRVRGNWQAEGADGIPY